MTAIGESAFLTKLVADVDDLPYTLFQPLVYQSAGLQAEIVVPAGFQTDVASIPRPLWALIPKEGRYNRPAVIHDWLYTTATVSGKAIARADADHALKEAMHACGVRWTQRWAIYAGVRLGGALAWRRHRLAQRG